MLRIKFEKKLDQAISRIRSGENISTVVSDYPKSIQNELLSSLNIALVASSLPKKSVPQPIKRKLFLQYSVQKASHFVQFMQTLRTSSAVLAGLLILAVAGTVSATASSLPGDKLFTVKKIFENARIQLAQSPSDRAQLELNLASQRLADAQQVLSQSSSDQQAKDQAIKELSEQTQNALNKVQAIATTPAVTKNPALLAQAESVASKQANLVAKVDPNAAKQTNDQITQIKNLVATVNDQSGTSIPALQKIDVTGNVTALTAISITVDKNVFSLDANLVIANKSGETLTLKDIGLGDTIEILGHTKDKDNIAVTITLISKPKIDTAKTDITHKPAVDQNQDQPSDFTEPPATTQDTFGGFIIEPNTK